MATLARSIEPLGILIASTPEGRDLGSRLGVRLECAIVANVVSVELVDGVLEAGELIFAGKAPLQFVRTRMPL